jgi:prepilin-type N-terminal cleavage/methylation domain-containing protein
MNSRCRAFTLVELMVVLALLVALAGGAGLALKPGDDLLALQGGQTLLIQSLALVRAQAALSGRNASLAVSLDSARPDQSMRALAVAVRNPSGPAWQRVSAWMPLPVGIALLPVSAPSGPWIEPGSDWSGLTSTALSAQPTLIGPESALLLEFTPRGTVVGGGGNLILATHRRVPPESATAFIYTAPDAVRGVSVSAYGVAEWIHERTGF